MGSLRWGVMVLCQSLTATHMIPAQSLSNRPRKYAQASHTQPGQMVIPYDWPSSTGTNLEALEFVPFRTNSCDLDPNHRVHSLRAQRQGMDVTRCS